MVGIWGAVALSVLAVEPVLPTESALPTPRESLGWVAEHQAVVDQSSKGDWRYLVAPAWADKDWLAGVSIALNTAINREGIPYRPTGLANGWACGINFAALCSNPAERKEVLAVWDSLALSDPYFHVPQLNSGVQAPVVAGHLRQEHVELVVAWSNQANRHGVVPVYNAAFAVSKMLSAAEGVFYELRGVDRRGSRKGLPTVRTHEVIHPTKLVRFESGSAVLLHDLRIGAIVNERDGEKHAGWIPVTHNGVVGYVKSERVRAGKPTSHDQVVDRSKNLAGLGDSVTEEDRWLSDRGASVSLSARFRADRRKGAFRSGVTGAPRSVVMLRGAVGRVWITEDVLGDRADRHPIHNLWPGKDGRLAADAKELIAEMPWGGHDYLLTDGFGEVQSVAVLAGNAVRDSTVPSPHPAILTPAISCIRCHWRGDHLPELARLAAGEEAKRIPNHGLRQVPNDVQVLLDPRGGVDLVDQTSNLSRLAGLYAGGVAFDRELSLGRDKLRLAVLQATEGLVMGSEGGLTVPQAADAVIKLFNKYRYEDVTAEIACLELGVKVGKSEAPERLSSLTGGAVDNPDATLLALIRGLSVRREDWSRVYHDAYMRVVSNATIDAPAD